MFAYTLPIQICGGISIAQQHAAAPGIVIGVIAGLSLTWCLAGGMVLGHATWRCSERQYHAE
jgi:hypothetical protein